MGLTPHPRFAAPETEGICFADSAANASLLGREWAGQPPLELAQAHALARERAVAPRTWRDEGGCQRYMLAAGLDARLCASFALPHCEPPGSTYSLLYEMRGKLRLKNQHAW